VRRLFILLLVVSFSACSRDGELQDVVRKNLDEVEQIIARMRAAEWGSTPSVVLITLDTTRADRLGPYRYPLARTPALDRFAEEAVVFERAFSPSSSTTPSHASILTGLYPYRHGVRDNGRFYLHPDQTTLAERLTRKGYSTAAFTSAYTVDHRFGLDQGFDVYRDSFRNARSTDARSFRGIELGEGTSWERSGDETLLEALRWIERAPRQPSLVWLHLFDPHEPYLPPIKGHQEQDYDSEIRFVDLLLERFLRGLRASGLSDSAIVIVVGDHGQALGEHGRCCHSGSVFDSVLRVPLILRLPGQQKGHRVDRLVRTIDIVPTVLRLLDIESESSFDGSSLDVFFAAEGSGAAPVERTLLADSQIFSAERSSKERTQKYAIRSRDFKIVRHYVDRELVEEQVYDLRIDPGELSPGAEIPAPLREALLRELDEFVARGRDIDTGATLLEITDEARRKLEALGYLQ
jgi:arylsulfatase A-like enzyme